MKPHRIVSTDDWRSARVALLAKEKEFTKLRDQLSRERRALPWTEVTKNYVFDTATGSQSLADLFAGRSQLIVQHFMFGPDWEEGCPSCSFWSDNFNGIDVHLNHRDITLVMVSNTKLSVLQAYRARMGWTIDWVSSLGSEFNHDFHVSFTPQEVEAGQMDYNYRMTEFPSSEAPGVSVFYRDDTGAMFHTYSCYSRGLDMLNGAYQLMDLAPKGRDEDDLPFTMAWLKRRDQYEK